MSDYKKLFCFGYGYTCDYLGHAMLQKGGWNVAGTTRDPEKKQILKDRGIDAYLFDQKRPLADAQFMLENVTHLLITTPPNDDGDPVFVSHANDIKKMKNLKWLGYLSTTSVYGDRGGEWVDETAKPNPSSQRGSRRLKAEEQWLGLLKSDDVPVHIFRLAGIYGPGRSALDSLRAGAARRINKPGHVFGRIHVEDIVAVLEKSCDNPAPGEIYNVCDETPSPSHEVIAYACELLGRAPPPIVDFEEADLAPITRSFYKDNRRVKNDKIREVLGAELKYKSYKEGLKACLDAEQHTVSLFGDIARMR